MDSDDAASMKLHLDDSYNEVDNYKLVKPSCSVDACLAANVYRHPNGNSEQHTDSQGNILETNTNGESCKLNEHEEVCGVDGCPLNVNAAGKMDGPSKSISHKELSEHTISRLQAMVMTDDDEDYDESLTCNVCDRAFHCQRQLASHQQKKRHFACSSCDSLFPSLMLLEHHKEEFEHWSEEEISRRVCCRRSRGDDLYFTDTDSFTSEAESEDLERLL